MDKRAATLVHMIPNCTHEPTSTQREFLDCPDLEVAWCGGYAAGKSEALLMAAAQFSNDPTYSALILVPTYADIVRPGGLEDRLRYLDTYEGRLNRSRHVFTFPSGATLRFGHYAGDGSDWFLRYKAFQFQLIAYDHPTVLDEVGYRYMISKLRRPLEQTTDIPLRIRAVGSEFPRWMEGYYNRNGRVMRGSHEDNPHVYSPDAEEQLRRAMEMYEELTNGRWDYEARQA